MRYFLLALAIALLLPGAAAAEETAAPPETTEWEPGPGERTEATRSRPDFTGMGFLFPLRLHLLRGGHVDGQIAGASPDQAQLLLIVGPGRQFRVDYDLVTAVTPLADLPDPSSSFASRQPPSLADVEVVYRSKPTWRSHAGLALNLIAPGTGHFIQKKEKALGFLFLGMDLFFLTAGSLAFFAPSRLQPRERAFFGIAFFSFDALTRGIGAGSAFNLGRERTAIPTSSAPGLAP